MAPNLPGRHVPNRVHADAESGGDRHVRLSSGTCPSNLAYVVVVQPRIVVRLAARHALREESGERPIPRGHPASLPRIGHVLVVRSEQQMVRPATAAVIAGMANEQPVGDRAVDQFVDVAVRSIEPAVHLDLPIPMPRDRADPGPAGIGTVAAIDARPDVFRRQRLRSPIAGGRAIFAAPLTNPSWCIGETSAALATDAIHVRHQKTPLGEALGRVGPAPRRPFVETLARRSKSLCIVARF